MCRRSSQPPWLWASLIDYWERAGCWLQQWTTLRNLADVLDDLGISEPARQLRGAADAASDAPMVTGGSSGPPPHPGPVGPGPIPGRHEVAGLARRAIEQALVVAGFASA